MYQVKNDIKLFKRNRLSSVGCVNIYTALVNHQLELPKVTKFSFIIANIIYKAFIT